MATSPGVTAVAILIRASFLGLGTACRQATKGDARLVPIRVSIRYLNMQTRPESVGSFARTRK